MLTEILLSLALVLIFFANLFFLESQRWRDLKSKLTSTFISGKLKQMLPTLLDIGNRFAHLKPLAEESSDVEIYDLLGRFNNNVISSCAFDFESDPL